MAKFFLVILCGMTLSLKGQDLQELYNQALDAYKAKNYAVYYEKISSAHQLHPYHQGILYNKGIAAALMNKPAEAIRDLKKAILANANFDLRIDELKTLTNLHGFDSLMQLQREMLKPIIQSDTAFVLRDRQVHAETVVRGIAPGEFFVSSVHKRKIIKVDAAKRSSDFTVSGQDGLAAVLGLKVDATNGVLWACASPIEEMEAFDSTAVSAVYKYDLKTGKLLASYPAPQYLKDAVFGDLILTKLGDVLVSDSRNNVILRVSPVSHRMDEFYKSDEFWNIQGIALSSDEKFLFIADYIKGIYRLSLSSGQLKQLTIGTDASLKSVDGLLYYQNSLIAIQNGISPMRVVQYFLNDTQERIVGQRTLDRGHPAFNEPTNGCIENDTLYYVANSQWSGYDKNHKIKPREKLQDIAILKVRLSPKKY